MRARLETLLNKVMGNPDEVYLLKADTLREIMLELKEMVKPAGAFEAGKTPVIVEENKGRAGFKLSVPEGATTGTAVTPYTMDWDLTTATAFVDTWDVTSQGGFDGVNWSGPRIVYDYSTDVITTDDNGNDTTWPAYNIVYWTRELSFSSTGQLIAISAETGGAINPTGTLGILYPV